MPDRRLLVLLWLLLCGSASLADPLSQAQVAARALQGDRYPRAEVSFAGGVRGLPGLVYQRRDGFRPLTLDLYLPPGDVGSSPLLLFVHGGGWAGGHPRALGALEDFPAVLAALAGRGYVVASVDYRLSGEARFPAQLEDIRSAMGWLEEQASNYGMDPTRMAIWGASAGAHLAALAAFDSPMPVRALVGWFGAYDLSTLLADADYPDIAAAAGRLLGCVPEKCSRTVAQAASPLARLAKRAPTSLLIHGDDDRVVPPAQSLAMAQALRQQGAEVELELIPAVGHGLVGAQLSVTRAANRRALEVTLAFLERALRARGE